MPRGGGEIRAWGRLLIPHFVQQGLSANAIIREVKKALGGRGWRRQVMLADIREAMGIMRLEKVVRGLPRDKRPPKSAMVETDLRRPRKYRVFADAEYMDLETRKVEKKTVSWYTDTLRTKEEWAIEFTDYVEREKYKPGFAVKSVEIKAIEHNRGFTY